MSSRTVYSTEHGRMCPDCSQPAVKCTCRSKNTSREQGGNDVKVSRETKGRKGKGVTVITGLPLPEKELRILAKKLKKKCGSGGTAKNGTIEIQGDHRDLLIEEIKCLGYPVKSSGG